MQLNAITKTLPAIILFLAALASHAGGQQHQPHETIIEAVKTYLVKNVVNNSSHAVVEVTPLDHRLKLRLCEAPLETFDPPGGSKPGNTSVGVRCEKPTPWSIYVSARVGLEMPVVTAVRDLARGQAVTAEDVALVTMDTTHLLRGYYDSLDQVIGRTLKRTLHRGRAITPSSLVVQKTVRRGELVTILAASGPIEVRMQGKAMRHGNPGDLIPVVNMKSKKKLQARVLTEGLVRVD